MTQRRPPQLATWLLQRLVQDRHKDALIGDLTELYATGRSGAWFWRQALICVVVTNTRALRSHAVPLAVAVGAAWGAILVWWYLNAVFIRNTGDVYEFLRTTLDGRERALDFRNTPLLLVWMLGALLRVLCFGVSGWLAAHLYSGKRVTVIAALAVTLFAWPLAWQQIRIVETDLMWLIHYGTGLGAIVLGACMARAPMKGYAKLI